MQTTQQHHRAAPITGVTEEPIEAGRYCRMPLGNSGLAVHYIEGFTARGSAIVRALDRAGATWCHTRPVNPADIWCLLTANEVKALQLPALPQ